MPHVTMGLVMLLLVLALSLGAVKANADTSPASGAAGGMNSPVNSFACDLYAHLSANGKGGNLFFSPFSMESALAMTAEGARGQTADEMGRVLCAAPESHTRDAARPWDLSSMHAGLGQLTDRLGGKPVSPELRKKISSLQVELAAANKSLESNRSYDSAYHALHDKAEKLAGELNGLLAQVDQYELRSANALWGEKTFSFERNYLDTLARFYKTGGLFPLDFCNDPEGSRKRINDWVSNQTRDRINDLIAAGQIRTDTRLVLTNAIYFKGEWSDPFEADQTKDEEFTALDGAKVRAPLMRKWGPAGAKYAAFNADGSLFASPDTVPAGEVDRAKCYPAADGFLVAELAYKGSDLSMVVILPQSPDGLTKLESKLTAANLASWTSQLRARSMEVFLPRFKLETDYDMVKPLQALGMNRAFVNPIDPNGAEFDGISPSTDPAQRLYIGAVIHKAFIDVNEKGTEAAAATAVIMAAGSAMPREVPFVPTFRADHSFILIIRENGAGTVLFMGRVTKPGG